MTTDGDDDVPESDDRPSDTDAGTRAWVENSSELLSDAADTYKGWERAVRSDSRLNEQLAQISTMLTQRTPGMKRMLEQFSQLSPPMPTVSPELVQALTRFSQLNVEFPRIDLEALRPALSALSSAQLQLDSIVPALRKMQASLNVLNAPSFARETQRFITETDALRYRGRQRVWHYTNAHALNQILRTHTLWASSPHHLNDASELIHGVEQVRAAVQRAADSGRPPAPDVLAALFEVAEQDFIEGAMHEIYYISASGAQDSLTLWRNYSTTDGFAIGIRPGRPLSAEGLVMDDVEPEPGAELPRIAAWYRVEYNDKKKADLSDRFVETAIHDIRSTSTEERPGVVRELRKHLLVLASTMKHRAFEDEREVRWITTNWAPVDVVHFEVTGRGFVPVLHVRSEGSDNRHPHLPIAGLSCSPTTAITVEHTMTALLRQRGYHEAATDVLQSKLPFRG